MATDLHEPYRNGLSPHLAHAQRVADPFHVVGVANRCLDTVRRRVQQETLGHRGRKRDPLYRIRRVLLRGAERLDERGNRRMLLALRVGDPKDEVLGAWLAKESVRDVYLAENVKDATTLLDKAIVGCAADDVPEIQALGRTLASWRTEILAHHETGASNGPTEALNLSGQEGQALRARIQELRALPTPGPASHRRRQMGCSTHRTDPSPLSPLIRVEPDLAFARGASDTRR